MMIYSDIVNVFVGMRLMDPRCSRVVRITTAHTLALVFAGAASARAFPTLVITLRDARGEHQSSMEGLWSRSKHKDRACIPHPHRSVGTGAGVGRDPQRDPSETGERACARSG